MQSLLTPVSHFTRCFHLIHRQRQTQTHTFQLERDSNAILEVNVCVCVCLLPLYAMCQCVGHVSSAACDIDSCLGLARTQKARKRWKEGESKRDRARATCNRWVNGNCTALCQICHGQKLKKASKLDSEIMVGKCDGGWPMPKAMLWPKAEQVTNESESSTLGSGWQERWHWLNVVHNKQAKETERSS